MRRAAGTTHASGTVPSTAQNSIVNLAFNPSVGTWSHYNNDRQYPFCVDAVFFYQEIQRKHSGVQN